MSKAKIYSGALNEPLVVRATTIGGKREGTVVASAPPATKYKVTNLYVDPDTGRLTVEYDDTPM